MEIHFLCRRDDQDNIDLSVINAETKEVLGRLVIPKDADWKETLLVVDLNKELENQIRRFLGIKHEAR